MRRFYLDKPQAKFLGVCAGIAAYTGWDALWVRVITLLLVLVGFHLLIPIYLVIAIVATSRRGAPPVEIYERPRHWSDYRSRFADIEDELRHLDTRFGR